MLRRTYMVRRGRRYLIERKSDGTFKRWLPKGKLVTKKRAQRLASRATAKRNVHV